MKKIVMRLLLYLLVACSEARRIPRGLEYDLFPNFRTVYHGHGATSYQNVDIQNYGSVPIPTKSKTIHIAEKITDYNHEVDHLHNYQHVHPAAALETQEHVVEHYIVSTAAPYYDHHVQHGVIQELEIVPHHYQHHDYEHYEYD